MRILLFLLFSCSLSAQNFVFSQYGLSFAPEYAEEYYYENGTGNLGNPFNYNELQVANHLVFDGDYISFRLGLLSSEELYWKSRQIIHAAQSSAPADLRTNLPDLFRYFIYQQTDNYEDNKELMYCFELPSKVSIFCSAKFDKKDEKKALQEFHQILSKLKINKATPLNTSTKKLSTQGDLKQKINSQLLPVSGLIQFESNGPWMDLNEKGELMICWLSASRGYKVTAFDVHTKSKLWEKALPNLELTAFCATEKGFAILGCKSIEYDKQPYPYLYLMEYGENQKLKQEVRLDLDNNIEEVGHQAYSETNRGCGALDYADGKFVAHYATDQKFDDGLVHQGSRVDIIQNGKARTWDSWMVSHSFQQKVVIQKDNFHNYSLGDAHPRGLFYNYGAFDDLEEEIYWDTTFMKIAGEGGDNYVADSRIDAVLQKADYTYILYDTEEAVKGKSSEFYMDEFYNDLFFCWIDVNNQKTYNKRLTNTYTKDEGLGKMIDFEDQLLIIYQEAVYPSQDPNEYAFNAIQQQATYLIIDKKGNIQSGPNAISTQFDQYLKKDAKLWLNFPTPPATEGTQFVQTKDGRVLWARFLLNQPYVELVEIEN